MSWDSLKSRLGSWMSRSPSPSSSPDPLASLSEKFHESPSGLAVPDSLNSFLSAHPALDARFGDIMSNDWLIRCPHCNTNYRMGDWHSCQTSAPVYVAKLTPFTAYTAPLPPLPVEKRRMPVIGYRAWATDASYRLGYGSQRRLKSTGAANSFWAPGSNVAKCHGSFACLRVRGPGTLGYTDIPNPDCECGFYVLADADKVTSHVNLTENHIVGAVLGWGKVVQHGGEGWRAQYVRIVALMDMKFNDANTKLARDISETYGVPILERSALELVVREYGEPVTEESHGDPA